MSLVGTRPILQDELQKYELHHRARIAIKPGITGMWQVSGRSDITDFEEVVRLDTEYISKGMVGTALVNNLKNIRDGKNKTRPDLYIDEIYEYDLNSTAEELDEYSQKADFVFNLAGVNRPENPEDFMRGNFGFASELLNGSR